MRGNITQMVGSSPRIDTRRPHLHTTVTRAPIWAYRLNAAGVADESVRRLRDILHHGIRELFVAVGLDHIRKARFGDAKDVEIAVVSVADLWQVMHSGGENSAPSSDIGGCARPWQPQWSATMPVATMVNSGRTRDI